MRVPTGEMPYMARCGRLLRTSRAASFPSAQKPLSRSRNLRSCVWLCP